MHSSFSLRTNEILPDLPFVNRAEEIDLICRFFENRSGVGANIAILDGDRGLGKTELIKRSQERLSEQHLVIWLPLAEGDSLHRDLYESAIYEILCAIDREASAGRCSIASEKLIEFAHQLSSPLVDGIRNTIDTDFSAFFNRRQGAIASGIRALASDIFATSARLHQLIRLIWNDGVKTIFIVEDLHKGLAQEGRRLIDLLFTLDKIPGSPSCWSVLVTCSPLRLSLNGENGLQRLWQVRNRWKIESWTVSGLSQSNMQHLAELYIENHEMSEPLIRAAQGSPTLFFNEIQKLSFHHRLTIHDRRVKLPANVADFVAFGGTFEEVLRADSATRLICGALAVGSTKLPLRVLDHLRGTLPGPVSENFEKTLGALEASSYVAFNTDASGDIWCRLRDDIIRDSAREALKGVILEEMHIHRALFDGYLHLFAEKDRTVLYNLNDLAHGVPAAVSAIPFVDLYPQACLHAVRGGISDWHRFAINAARLLDHFGRFAEVITFIEAIQMRIDAIFDQKGDISMLFRSLLSKAHYYLHNLDGCLNSMSDENIAVCSKSEILYYQAASTIGVKINENPEETTGIILKRVKSHNNVDREWLPQILTAHAFALLEKGSFAKAIATYALYFAKTRFFVRHDVNWHTFAMMSPLFLPVSIAHGLCSSAHKFFLAGGHMRLAGMAMHNLGYCSLRRFDLDEAYQLFDKADTILSVHAQQEAGFCKTNKAFIHLVRNQGREAKAQSSDALKFFTSPFYISAARVNLALADWMLGSRNAVLHLEQVPDVVGLALDPNQSWRLAFNRAFIALQTPGHPPTQQDVDKHFEELKGTQSTRDAAVFWDSLVADLRLLHPDLNWPTFSKRTSRTLSFISPELAPFRASTLCFGHA